MRRKTLARQMPDINETELDHTPQHTVHNTINHFTCEDADCQGNLFKSLFCRQLFLLTLPKSVILPPLTKPHLHAKMPLYADVVELVDSLDLGAVTSVKVLWVLL